MLNVKKTEMIYLYGIVNKLIILIRMLIILSKDFTISIIIDIIKIEIQYINVKCRSLKKVGVIWSILRKHLKRQLI